MHRHGTYVFLTASRCYFPVRCASLSCISPAPNYCFFPVLRFYLLVIRLYFVTGCRMPVIDSAFFLAPPHRLRLTVHGPPTPRRPVWFYGASMHWLAVCSRFYRLHLVYQLLVPPSPPHLGDNCSVLCHCGCVSPIDRTLIANLPIADDGLDVMNGFGAPILPSARSCC